MNIASLDAPLGQWITLRPEQPAIDLNEHLISKATRVFHFDYARLIATSSRKMKGMEKCDLAPNFQWIHLSSSL
jgi:hypothetical protein